MSQHSNHFSRAVRIGAALSLLGLASGVGASVNDRPYFNADATVIVFGASGFNDQGGIAPVVVDFHTLKDGVSGQAAFDLIAADGVTINVNSGQFNAIFSEEAGGIEYQINDAVSGGEFNSVGPHQILDPGDSYNAFEVDEDTDVDLLNNGNRASRFFVASNAAFDIYAQAENLETSNAFDALDLSNIRYRIRLQTTGGGVNGWGAQAQNPSIGGNGITVGEDADIAPSLATLADIAVGPTQVFDGGRRTAQAPGGLIEQAISFQSRYNLIGADIGSNNYDFSLGAGTIAADVVYTVYVP